jgi:cobalt-zinc-cadmium efflux system protein
MSGAHHHATPPDGHESASFESSGGRHRRALAVVLALVLAFVGVEAVVGVLTGSLTLVADAGHMATDALGVGMALAAVSAARRAVRKPTHTFGHYRWEVLAALANAALLLGVARYVAIEAIGRLRSPVHVDAAPMLVVAILGLGVNLVSYRLLHQGAKESLNVRGAALEVMADAIGSVGVIVSALVILTTGWPYADAVVALALAAFIAPRAISLGAQAVRILIQSAPASVDVDSLRSDLAAIESITDVHDVHVWTLTSGMDVASAHLVSERANGPDVVRAAQAVLREHGLAHATVQVEDGTGRDCGAEW